MRDDIQIKDDLYAYLKTSTLMTGQNKVNGVLRKTRRPLNSDKEDVVISVLANQNGEIQNSYVNVNVYVPDQYRDNQYEENSARLRTLCDICKTLLLKHIDVLYQFELESQRVLEVNGKNEHFINNRLLYKTLNE